MAIARATQYARGVVPHQSPTQAIEPAQPCEFIPFSSEDPLLANDEDDVGAGGAVAPPTSSYEWMLR